MKFNDYIDLQRRKTCRPVLMLNCNTYDIIVNNRRIPPGESYIQYETDVDKYADQNQVFVRYT